MQYTKPHEVEDWMKIHELTTSMQENGWQGVPVVVWGDMQLTGVHRAKAAENAGVGMPTINLEEIFVEDGADWEEALAEYNDCPNSDPFSCVLWMLPYLSTEIKTRYGIDLEG